MQDTNLMFNKLDFMPSMHLFNISNKMVQPHLRVDAVQFSKLLF